MTMVTVDGSSLGLTVSEGGAGGEVPATQAAGREDAGIVSTSCVLSFGWLQSKWGLRIDGCK